MAASLNANFPISRFFFNVFEILSLNTDCTSWCMIQYQRYVPNCCKTFEWSFYELFIELPSEHLNQPQIRMWLWTSIPIHVFKSSHFEECQLYNIGIDFNSIVALSENQKLALNLWQNDSIYLWLIHSMNWIVPRKKINLCMHIYICA